MTLLSWPVGFHVFRLNMTGKNEFKYIMLRATQYSTSLKRSVTISENNHN